MRYAPCALFLAALSVAALPFVGCAAKLDSLHGDAGARGTQFAMTPEAASQEKVLSPLPGKPQVALADAGVDPAAPHDQRAMVYQAALAMVVPDIAAAQRELQRQAQTVGGYLEEINGAAITVRVPVARFQETLSAAEKLGEVTERHVKANDVTEEMRDLGIRLANAEEVRKRLGELVEKSARMEDTIKLEQELERVTQTLELLKGKIQFLQSQVALSTLRVAFNSTRPQQQTVMALPFAWVRDLGDGVAAGISENSPDTSRLWKRNERFTLPAGFVRYFERDHVTEAMSGDEIIIKLHRQDNYDGGAVGFWNQLARKVLVENRAVALTRESDTALKDKTPARVLSGTRDLGGKKQGYFLGLAATQRYVYTFEAWGDQDKLEKALPTLEAAFQTLDVKHW